MHIAPIPKARTHSCSEAPPAPLDLSTRVPADTWAALPACLQRRFAPGHGGMRFAGTMDLQRSTVGAAFALLARAFGAPLPLRTVPGAAAEVQVREVPTGIEWTRRIGNQLVRSIKSSGPANTVLEHTQGGLGMVLDVTVEQGALVFTSRAFFLAIGRWRLPIPTLLTPGQCRVAHQAVDATRFRFSLTMTHPLWGVTVRQDGLFTTVRQDGIFTTVRQDGTFFSPT